MNYNNHEKLERTFMQALLKHTGIALAILVPLAAYTTYAHADTISNQSVAKSKTNPNLYKQELETVDSVNLKKYAGQWYEIARLPMRFQKNCKSDVSATYNLNTDSDNEVVSVDVINKCLKEDGSIITATGLAKPVDNTGSKLQVSFLPKWLRWLPVGKANYWVLGLDNNYNHALVGTPDYKYLWLLSRKPNMPIKTFNTFKSLAEVQGYDISKLKITSHKGNNPLK